MRETDVSAFGLGRNRATTRRASARRTATAVALVMLLGLAGCSSIPDALNPVEWYEGTTDTVGGWFSDDEDTDEQAGGDKAYPNLATVPDKPTPSTTEEERAALTSGLAADRDNAKYADETQRPATGTSTAASTAVAAASSAAPVPSSRSSSDSGRSSLWPNRQAPGGDSNARATSARVGSTHPITKSEPARTPTVRAEPARQPVPPPPPSTPQVAAAPAPPPAAPSTQFDSATQGGAPTPAPADQSSSVITDAPTLAQYESNLSGEVYLAGTVYFGHSSASLTGDERRMIADIARAAVDSNAMVKVVGHASSRTAEMSLADHEFANFSVSLSRAEAVAQALIDAGLSADSVIVEALSDSQPLYYESMPSGESGNRRAEILLLY